MTVRLQPARSVDAAAVSTILTGWIDENTWMPRIHSVQEYAAFGQWLIEVTDVTVACCDGTVVGFIARRQDEVHSLYLASNARRQGIGKKLLDNAKDRQTHLGLWTFQSNTGARRFYARNGFVDDVFTDGQGNDEKLPDVHMIWARDTV